MSAGAATCSDRLSTGTRAILALIGLYQKLRSGRPSPCRYWPTCSEYAREAVERYGARRGLRFTARRLLRCQPWGGWGVDPVPLIAAPLDSTPGQPAPGQGAREQAA